MMSPVMDKLNVFSTWETAEGRNIRDSISVDFSNNRELQYDLDDLVKLETCVQFFRQNSETSSPEINLNFSEGLKICAIRIISEARIIELYGRGGEYLSTVHSEFVDDFEGMAVYSAYLELSLPSSECSLKFNKLRHQDNFWLYGIGLYVEECKECNNSNNAVDLESVHERLKLSGCNITENAGQCMKLLQTFRTLANPGGSSLLNMHQTQKTSDLKNPKKLCDLLFNMSQIHSSSKTLSNSVSDLPEEIKKLSLSDSNAVDIEALMDIKFKRMEENIMARVDERFDKIDQKIDSLALLVLKQYSNVHSRPEVKN